MKMYAVVLLALTFYGGIHDAQAVGVSYTCICKVGSCDSSEELGFSKAESFLKIAISIKKGALSENPAEFEGFLRNYLSATREGVYKYKLLGRDAELVIPAVYLQSASHLEVTLKEKSPVSVSKDFECVRL